ncbi:MAG: PAS domain S-box protein [Chitinophagaceae bacterium]
MKPFPYLWVIKYFIAGFLVGVLIILADILLNDRIGFGQPLFSAVRYSYEFILIILSPLYLSLLFGIIGLQKVRFIRTRELFHGEVLAKQMVASASDTHMKLIGQIVSQLNEIIVISDASGNMEWINASFTVATGYTLTEVYGKHLLDFLPVAPESKGVLDKMRADVMKGNTAKEELLMLHKNSTPVWMYVSVKPIFDEAGTLKNYVSVLNDISMRKQRELAIQTLAHEIGNYKLAIDQSAMVAVFDSEGKIVRVNQKFCEINQLSEELLIGADYRNFGFTPRDETEVHAIWATLRTGTTWKGELENVSKKGIAYWADTTIVPLTFADGTEAKFILMQQDITATKEAELLLKKSEREKAIVLSNTQTIICIHDMNGVMLDINPAAEKASGFKKEEIVGMHLRLIVTPEYQPAFDEYLSEIKSADFASGALQIFTRSGVKRVWHYQNTVYKDETGTQYVIASAIDVTESVKAQNEIERQEQFIRQIIDNSPNVIFMLNEHREVVLANKTFSNFYSYNVADLPLADSLSQGDEDIFLGNGQNLFDMSDEEIRQKEGCIRSRSGDVLSSFNVIKKCFRDKKGKRFLMGYGMDITKRYQIESDLLIANKLVEKSLKVKDQFISNMSHEIRTPLNAVIGFTDLLAETTLNPKQTEFVEIVKTASVNLLGIINNILDLSKIEASNLVLESAPVKLQSSINDVVKILEIKAKVKGLEILTKFDDDLPEYVLGDQLRVNQILFNLISNAIKFTDTGSVEIGCHRVEGPDAGFEYVAFSVADTGIGVPEEKQHQIFERFSQANTNTQRLYGGTGLGLNITQSIVDLFRGTISINSEVGKGTVFTVVLPLRKCQENFVIPDVKNVETRNVNARQIKGKVRILLAEDNMVNAMLATEVLTNKGFVLTHVTNGELAVEIIQKEHFDLILMDIQMPVMNGIDATIAIRQLAGHTSQIPIIAMTAHSLNGEMNNCYNSGMNGYVSKPFRATELLEKINSLIKHKDAA